jgi:predicted RNase H-like nuclease
VRVLGVDGCRRGWVVVALGDGRFESCRLVASLADIVDDPARVIGVDIPLGEPPGVKRAAEPAARRFIRTPLRGAVFTPAPRATLEAESHADACDIAQRLTGSRIARQAWELRTKMVDAYAPWAEDPKRFREVHPEVSFAAIADGRLESKKTWSGHRARVALLRSVGIEIPDDLGTDVGLAGPDDVLDAAVVAWSAARLARGEGCSLPDPPERDVDGRAIAIWY